MSAQEGLPRGEYTPLWTEFLTHACENITFPQLLLRTVTSPLGHDAYAVNPDCLISIAKRTIRFTFEQRAQISSAKIFRKKVLFTPQVYFTFRRWMKCSKLSQCLFFWKGGCVKS